MKLKEAFISVFVVIVLFGCGCLEGNEEVKGFSASKHYPTAKIRAQETGRTLVLVVVTAEDPQDAGRAMKWKYAYNDITSGYPLSSYTFEADTEGNILENTGEPLSKDPIKNWSVDSTTAFSLAREEMMERELINEANDVHVDYIYLLGDNEENNGCEWSIGTSPYEEATSDLHITVDGSTGEVLSIKSSK
ncbi:MAG: hypothetical protein R6V01_01970 [Thermoplasmatota archaeon]